MNIKHSPKSITGDRTLVYIAVHEFLGLVVGRVLAGQSAERAVELELHDE